MIILPTLQAFIAQGESATLDLWPYVRSCR